MSIAEPNLAILMFESALLATPEAKGALELLLNNTASFPFQLPVMSGDFVSQRSGRIDVVRYGLDDDLLKLRAIKSGMGRECLGLRNTLNGSSTPAND